LEESLQVDNFASLFVSWHSSALIKFQVKVESGRDESGVSLSFCAGSVGFYSWAFLVFLMKESKKRRRKQPGKLMAKSICLVPSP